MNALSMIVFDHGGRVAAVAQTNAKAAAKSIERDELWFLHATTDRVLPWNGGGVRFTRLQEQHGSDGGSWYEVQLAEDRTSNDAPDSDAPAGGPTGGELVENAGDSEDTISAAGEILGKLTRIIRRRRREMPEGSYTTHLFEKGADKIRKKTGEEAVELILARTPDELRYEAADLIYHLMVLLEVEDDSLATVLAELRGRLE